MSLPLQQRDGAAPWNIDAEQRLRGLASLCDTMSFSWKDAVSVAQRAEITCVQNTVGRAAEWDRNTFYVKHMIEIVNAIRASRYSVHLSVAMNQALLMRAGARPDDWAHPHFSLREWASLDTRSSSMRQIASTLMRARSVSTNSRGHLSDALKLAFHLEWWAYSSNGKDMWHLRMANLVHMFTPLPLNYSKTELLPRPLRAEVARFLCVPINGSSAPAAGAPVSAPDEDGVECTGVKTWAERDRELRAKAVVLD